MDFNGRFFCFGNSVRGGRDAINRVSTYARIKPPQSIKSIGDRWLMINIHVYDLASQQNFPIRRRGIVWGFLSNIFRPINRFDSGFLKGEFWFRKLLMMKRLVCFLKMLRNVFFKIVGLRFFLSVDARLIAHLQLKKPCKQLVYKVLSVLIVIPFGFEPKTCSLEVSCSIQLSYGTVRILIKKGNDCSFP